MEICSGCYIVFMFRLWLDNIAILYVRCDLFLTLISTSILAEREAGVRLDRRSEDVPRLSTDYSYNCQFFLWLWLP